MTGSTWDIVVMKSVKNPTTCFVLCAVDVIAICSSLWGVLWILH